MKRILLISLILMWVSAGYANEEITVDLPGGATMEMVWIEPGTFLMGTTEKQEQLLRSMEMWGDWDEEREKPAHEVVISKGFYLGKFELIQEQWQSVMGTTPWSGRKQVQSGPNYPAVYISWEDMQTFIHRLNQAAGDSLYRLPTEAEWEYACRAGTATLWAFGDDEGELENYGWHRENSSGGIKEVGMKRPNPWGLYDMHGNVWEWCLDWSERGGYPSYAQVDPIGNPERRRSRVIRGGSFFHSSRATRSAYRSSFSPEEMDCYFGARLLRVGPQITAVPPTENNSH